MHYIELINEFDPDRLEVMDKDKAVNVLFKGPFRQVIEVRLQNSAVLSKHKADVPITVFCIAGKGVFRAGPGLVDAQPLRAGTLITVEAGIDHEVVADPALHIIVTKFNAI